MQAAMRRAQNKVHVSSMTCISGISVTGDADNFAQNVQGVVIQFLTVVCLTRALMYRHLLGVLL